MSTHRQADLAVAATTAVALTLVALDGGSFDLVVRQGWATFVWWALALAAVTGLAFRSRLHPTGVVPLVALIALGAWTALSLSWTSSDELTLVEVARLVAYLGVLVAVVAVVPPASWRAVIAGTAIAAFAVCAWALAHRIWPSGFDDTVSIFAGDSRRLSAPFGYWNAVGSWAGMTSALCLGFSAHARSRAWRFAAGAAVPFAIAVSYLTYSRASLGGTALGLLVLLLLSRNRATLLLNALAAALAGGAVVLVVRGQPEIAEATGGAGGGAVLATLLAGALAAGGVSWATGRLGADRARLSRRAARVAIPVGAVAAGLAVIVVSLSVGPDLWDQFTTRGTDGAADPASRLTNLNGNRYDIWKVSLEQFERASTKGTGAGTFEYTWNQYGYGGFVRDAHSLYFEALSELGWPALLCILLLIVGVIAALVRAIRLLEDPLHRGILAAAAGAISAYLLGAGVDWLWESPAVTVLPMVLIGAVILAGARPAPPPSWAVRIPLALAAVLLCVVQLPGLVSTSEVRKSQRALSDGDVAGAREHADNAIDAQPWAASPLVQRALVDERAGALDAAQSELRAAAAREPQDWRAQLLLARVEAKRGDAQAALRAFRRARELRPTSRFFLPQ